jgi:hypothetical protein
MMEFAGLSDPYEDAVTFYPDRVGGQGIDRRFTQRVAIANIELPLMQRALDNVPVQEAVAEPGAAVRTDVSGGKQLTANAVHSHFNVGGLYSNDVIDGKVVR